MSASCLGTEESRGWCGICSSDSCTSRQPPGQPPKHASSRTCPPTPRAREEHNITCSIAHNQVLSEDGVAIRQQTAQGLVLLLQRVAHFAVAFFPLPNMQMPNDPLPQLRLRPIKHKETRVPSRSCLLGKNVALLRDVDTIQELCADIVSPSPLVPAPARG